MGLIQTFTRSLGAVARDYVMTDNGRDASIAAAALVAGTLYVARVYPERDFVMTQFMWLNGGTIGSSAEGLVFTYDGTNWNRIGTTGVVAQSGTSAIQAVTGLSIPISRGAITYLGLIPNNATGFFGRNVAAASGMNSVSPSGLLSGAKASVNQPCPSQVASIVADIRTLWLAGTV